MLKQKGNKAFTLIEILVVIVIIIIFVIFAAPNVANYATEREVKKEVYRFVEYFKQRKGDVQSGKYGVYYIGQTSPEQDKSYNWYMTPEEFAIQLKIPAPGRTNRNNASNYNNKSIMNYHRMCPGSPQNSPDGRWTKDSADAFQWSDKVYTWPNKKYCVTKDAYLHPGGLEFNVTSAEKGSFLICTRKNTTHPSGSNRCNFNNKNDFRYAIQIARDLKLKVYKYNLKKDKWILQ